MPQKELLLSIFLGVIQGITEFLPISSDGHLTILSALWERINGETIPEPLQLFLVLHVGTLLSILVIYFHDLSQILLRRQWRLIGLIVVASIPAALAGLTLKPVLEPLFKSPVIAALGLWVTAGMLWMGRKLERKDKAIEEPGFLDALWIGLWQVTALLPGVSRSGSTIVAALIMGVSRKGATRFSFLIAVPIIAGACLLDLKDTLRTGTQFHPGCLILGAAVSFVVGFFALRVLLLIVSRGKLGYFIWYLLFAGGITLAWQGFEHIRN